MLRNLFHGSHIFNPQKYPPERRHEVLRKLIGISGEFGLLAVYGYNDKIGFEALHKLHPRRGRSNPAPDRIDLEILGRSATRTAEHEGHP